MASSSAPRILTYKNDAAVAAYVFVKKGTDDKHVAVCSAATDKMVGIQQNVTTTAEDKAEVAVAGGGAKLKLGGTVTAGDKLTSDASGYGIATTTNADSSGAIAMADGVSGDVIGVEVVIGTI